jgi:hypothetical protein
VAIKTEGDIMNIMNFKVAAKLNVHADEVTVEHLSAINSSLVGVANTPKGQYDFMWYNGDFSYLAESK